MKKAPFQKFIKKNAKIVNYQVTDHFAGYNIGDIIDAYLITEDGDSAALLYFPFNNRMGYTGTFELCEYIENEKVFIAKYNDGWVNFN